MKRVVVDHCGGPEVPTVIDDEVPRPEPGEVGVRVLAAGVGDEQARHHVGFTAVSSGIRRAIALQERGSLR